MLGIDHVKISPEIMRRAAQVEAFRGTWAALETYSTGLQILGEVAEHGKAFRRLLDLLMEQEITAELIQTVHATQTGGGSKPSAYKTEENELPIMKGDVPAGFIETAAPEDVEPLMDKLVEWLNSALDEQDMPPLLTMAIFTSVFLQISPFKNGNARTARFLILLVMLKHGYTYAPYARLDHIMKERGDEVYQALKHNQDSLEAGKPDWSVWLRCFFSLLEDQAGELQERLEAKDEEVVSMPTLSARILGLFEQHQRLQMKEIINLTNGRRATIKLRLQELLSAGYLKRHGRGRSTWYALV